MTISTTLRFFTGFCFLTTTLISGSALIGRAQTPASTTAQVSRYAAWSPNRQAIIFESNVSGDFDIYTLSIDGAGRRRLTEARGRDGLPQWSPDGKRVAFIAGSGWPRSAIYVMKADGTDVRKIVN